MIIYIRGSAMQGSGDLHIKIGITGKKSDEFLPFLALKHPSALIWRVYKSSLGNDNRLYLFVFAKYCIGKVRQN